MKYSKYHALGNDYIVIRPTEFESVPDPNSIRLAGINDLARVVAIVTDAVCHMNDQGIYQWDDLYPNTSILQADIENRDMYVIENSSGIVGLISLNEEQHPEYEDVPWTITGRALIIHRLTIAPEHQGKKLASRLMDFAEIEIAPSGYDTIRLDAFTQNPAALALYEGRGYRKAGTVRFRKGLFFCYEKAVSWGRIFETVS